jgi:hypothetical protein
MGNESSAGRDGWLLAHGRRIYHVYKQNFPMEFWYGLTPEANREDSPRLIDVRTLPEKYHLAPLEVRLTGVPRRSWPRKMREQLNAHAMAFAAALADGYDLEAHIEREHRKTEEAASKRRAPVANRAGEGAICFPGADFDVPF